MAAQTKKHFDQIGFEELVNIFLTGSTELSNKAWKRIKYLMDRKKITHSGLFTNHSKVKDIRHRTDVLIVQMAQKARTLEQWLIIKDLAVDPVMKYLALEHINKIKKRRSRKKNS